MEVFLFKALQLIGALSLLVLIHEFGHYIFARMFGIRVEKFYLFFNPSFSLLKYDPRKGTVALISSTDNDGNERALLTLKAGRPHPAEKQGKSSWRDTIYGIGWLPLGGYCKIAGMIDESMDKEQMAAPAQPWEFRSKPAYQRLFVMIGGVLFNFLLAIVIYIAIAFTWGEKTIQFRDAYAGLDFVPAAQNVGFRNGDIPLSADGRQLDATDRDVMMRMIEANEVTVLRGTDTVSIAIPDDFIFRLNDDQGFYRYRIPVVVSQLMPGQPAAEAGMLKGDRIIAVGDSLTPSFTELSSALRFYAGQTIPVKIIRDQSELTLNLKPTENGKLGFQLTELTDIYPVTTISYSLLSSIPKGIELGTSTLGNYVSSFKHVFSKEGAQSLGGFGALGSIFPEKNRWSWLSFWEITAFLSVALAFMNIIPIPALDGGHVMFLIYEAITRRQPSEKFMEYAQYCGMAFLLLLLLYANGNDIYRFFLK